MLRYMRLAESLSVVPSVREDLNRLIIIYRIKRKHVNSQYTTKHNQAKCRISNDMAVF